MIGPGWIPAYRPRPLARRRTLPYTRSRRRSRARMNKQATVPPVVNTEIVLFDHGPTEFPVATAIPREPGARMTALMADLQRWLLARWRWFRPRTVPCVVAGLGMLAVIASANYLAHPAGADAPASRVVHVQLAPR